MKEVKSNRYFPSSQRLTHNTSSRPSPPAADASRDPVRFRIYRGFTGFPFDFAQGGESFDFAQDRESSDFAQDRESFDFAQDREPVERPVERPVEPRISLREAELVRNDVISEW